MPKKTPPAAEQPTVPVADFYEPHKVPPKGEPDNVLPIHARPVVEAPSTARTIRWVLPHSAGMAAYAHAHDTRSTKPLCGGFMSVEGSLYPPPRDIPRCVECAAQVKRLEIAPTEPPAEWEPKQDGEWSPTKDGGWTAHVNGFALSVFLDAENAWRWEAIHDGDGDDGGGIADNAGDAKAAAEDFANAKGA